MIKTLFRKLARALTTRIHIRGRHRFADLIGPMLAPKEIEILDLDGIAFPVDHSISSYRHAYYGIYEEENVQLLRSLVREGDVCIDAGANIGYLTSVLAASAGQTGRVFAFEPSRTCLRTLTFLEDVPNVEVLPDAIGARDSTAPFYDTDRAITKGYAFLAALRDDPGDATRYDVRVRSIDEFSDERGVSHLRLLKLDIEGAELAALHGAADMLGRQAIEYILLESSFGSSSEDRARDVQIAALLEAVGYGLIATHGRDGVWKAATAT